MKPSIPPSFQYTFCLLLLALFTSLSLSQPATPRDDPEDIQFVLRLKDGKTQFRQGEIINLELSFTSTKPNTYSANTANYDRSGRLEMDKFHVSPKEGTSDPLYDYFHSGGGFMGGGVFGMVKLTEKPLIINYRLNEWLRFDRPGKYKLHIASPRVSRIKDQKSNFGEPLSAPLISNTIEFEIVPAEPTWAKQELAKAITLLDDSKQTERHVEASCILRHLETEAAAREMIRRYDGNNFQFYLGLLSSTKREFIMAQMEKRIALPEQAVSHSYLNVLSQLTFFQRAPYRPPSGVMPKEEEEYYRKRHEIQNQINEHYANVLAGAIAQKKGQARAISIATLFNYSSSSGAASWLPKIAAEIPAIFEDLPPNLQQSFLGWEWQKIASPAMLPVLKKIYEKSDEMAQSDQRSLALRRIYELSPTEGRQLILEEIRKGSRINFTTLSLLPDETLPELDDVLATQIAKSEANLFLYALLVERYATAAIAPRVREVYGDKGGSWACDIQSAWLAYFLRVDAAMGAQLTKEALASRDKTGCYNPLLRDVAKLHFNSELEQIALQALDDESPEVAASAANALGQHGSANVEKILWQRFETWHARWQGRAQELNAQTIADQSLQQQRQLESNLLGALSGSPAWLADSAKLTQLRSFCVTKNCLDTINQYAARWKDEIELEYMPETDKWGTAEVAQYRLASLAHLKRKIAQFPSGTTFKWRGNPAGHPRIERVYLEVNAFIEEQGMKLLQ